MDPGRIGAATPASAGVVPDLRGRAAHWPACRPHAAVAVTYQGGEIAGRRDLGDRPPTVVQANDGGLEGRAHRPGQPDAVVLPGQYAATCEETIDAGSEGRWHGVDGPA